MSESIMPPMPDLVRMLREMPHGRQPVGAEDGSGRVVAYVEDGVVLGWPILQALLDEIDAR